jgi:hypothetical protein
MIKKYWNKKERKTCGRISFDIRNFDTRKKPHIKPKLLQVLYAGNKLIQ